MAGKMRRTCAYGHVVETEKGQTFQHSLQPPTMSLKQAEQKIKFDRLAYALTHELWPNRRQQQLCRHYERAVERFFNTGNAFAFWKGRIALYAILNALGVGAGDEIIVPGYTCVMVPGPVIYCGARPVYADIDPCTYGIAPREVERKITGQTKAILVQHTYGIPAAIEEIQQIADSHGIAIIEDCCHTFGGRLNGKLLGSFGRAAFFSAQWNKTFNTGLGGLALIHDRTLAEKVRRLQMDMPLPSSRAAAMLAFQLLAYEAVVWPSTATLARRFFRWMAHKGLNMGSSDIKEFGVHIPINYALQAASVQCRVGCAEVGRVEENRQHRQWVTRQYLQALPLLGHSLPDWGNIDDLMLVRLPLRVANKQEVLNKAVMHGVEIGAWFECPLHPAMTDQKAFGYSDGDCPHGEQAAREVINLPTHRRVNAGAIARTLAFVRDVCKPVKSQS